MKRALLAAPLAAAFFLLSVAGAEAHAAFLRSFPGPGAVVASEPKRVEIWFTQDLFRRQGENWIHVVGSDVGEVHVGEAQIDDDDRRHMWIDLQSPLPAGEYRVEWRSLSAEDGDHEEGEFVFTLDPHAQVTSTPMQAHTETPVPSTTPSTEVSATAHAGPTSGPTSEADSGCALGLAPVLALAAAGLGMKRRRS